MSNVLPYGHLTDPCTITHREAIPNCKVMFCRVCGFRVRVWESYRTSRSFGYGYESDTERPEVPGIVTRVYILTEVPGTGMNALQN